MPRAIPPALQAALDADAVVLALLVRLDRTDGLSLGFTNADSAIDFGGLTYHPSDYEEVSAIASVIGTGVDNMDTRGVLSSSRITETDLLAGLWAGAGIVVRIVNRDNVAAGAVAVLAGSVGDVTLNDGVFRAECRSLGARLRQTVGDATSKLCRCKRLGDAQCKVNMAGTAGGFAIRATRAVGSASQDGLTITMASDSAATGHYSWGVLRFTSGANSGISRDIKAHTLSGGSAVLVLREAFPFAVVPGDTAVIEAGCDRTFPTCQTKFSNANNYHGEWQLPGNDTLIKSGRGGQA